MRARIALAGGDDAFLGMLDTFFGFGAGAVTQPGRAPSTAEMAAGYRLNRFEGLNNEPDMEAPWAYHYAGRQHRTADVVHAALTWQFGTDRGGLPGNDDSGGLSSWYVWASLGFFPVAGGGRRGAEPSRPGPRRVCTVPVPRHPGQGVHDLVRAYAASASRDRVKLVLAGRGPALAEVRELAGDDDRILFLADVDDDEKPLLMHGCAAYALPTKPEPDFVERSVSR